MSTCNLTKTLFDEVASKTSDDKELLNPPQRGIIPAILLVRIDYKGGHGFRPSPVSECRNVRISKQLFISNLGVDEHGVFPESWPFGIF